MSSKTLSDIDLRIPVLDDAAQLATFIQDCAPLEPNTTYAYLLFCTHFSRTSLIARDDEGIVGAIVGYRPPAQPDTVFVWQIGVHERARGTGLGGRMLASLIRRLADEGVCYLEATVSPSNEASDRLFRKFAERNDATCVSSDHFEASHFGVGNHEPENLYRIGPITSLNEEKNQK